MMIGCCFFGLITVISIGKCISLPADSSRQVFVRWETDRTRLYVGETFLLRLRMYYSGNISAPEDYPKLKLANCWLEELPEKPTPSQQTINGIQMGAVTLKTYLVMPQKSGELVVEPYAVSIRVTVPPKPDDFFQVEQTVSQSLRSPSLLVQIQPLPEPKPLDFSGGVGRFSWDVQIPTDTVLPQKQIRLTYRIAGNGNLIFTALPVFTFPVGLEGFDVKTTDAVKITRQGMTGNRVFSQTLVAEKIGTYQLPFSFTYFDTNKKTFVTHTDTVTVVVAGKHQTPSSAAVLSVAETSARLNDFPRWHRHTPVFQGRGSVLESPWWWVWVGLPVGLLGFAYGWAWRRHTRRQSPKRPYRQAISQLRRVQQQMTVLSPQEVSRQLEETAWLYLSQKYDLSPADWSVHQLDDLLQQQGVFDADRFPWTRFLYACAEVRFARQPSPFSGQEQIHTLKILIQKLEKKPTKLRLQRAGLLGTGIGIVLLFSAATPATRYQQAKDYHHHRQSDSALVVLHALVQDGYTTAEVYNALANSYIQHKKIGLAVWYYEKALQVSPDDSVVVWNVATLRQKQGLAPPVVSPIRQWLPRISTGLLFWMAVGLLWLGAAAVVLTVAGRIPQKWKKTGNRLMILGFACLMATFWIHHENQQSNGGIVILATKAYYAPSVQARELAFLPEGTWVQPQEHFAGWIQVRTTDGKKVWVEDGKIAGIFIHNSR